MPTELLVQAGIAGAFAYAVLHELRALRRELMTDRKAQRERDDQRLTILSRIEERTRRVQRQTRTVKPHLTPEHGVPVVPLAEETTERHRR